MESSEEVIDALKNVHIRGGFWSVIQERNHQRTVPHLLKESEKIGQSNNFRLAAGEGKGEHSGENSGDSNVYKVMEGMAYCLEKEDDPEFQNILDELIRLISGAQEEDGYLNTYRTVNRSEEHYSDLHRSHELYVFGHLIEAGVAHFEATGKRDLLEIAIRVADHVDAVFGPGKMESTSGHQEIEMALFRLYRVTFEERYKALGRYFVDMRGNKEMVERDYGGKPIIENDRTPGRNRPPEYRQDHALAVDQKEAVGHAVRAGYLYSAMADIAKEDQCERHKEACLSIWKNIVEKKIYLSGGVGTHQYHDEGYGDDYLLPNTGYCETCGGIALMFFAHRLSLIDNRSDYADVIEQILFNHVLSSTDLSGTKTFYRNPLSAQGPRERHPWNFPPCCCTNVVRVIPQISRYLHRVKGSEIYIEQYAEYRADIKMGQGSVKFEMKTDYPWSGKIFLRFLSETEEEVSVNVRVPGWTKGRPFPSDLYSSSPNAKVKLSVNGSDLEGTENANGYMTMCRYWKKGDRIELNIELPVQRNHAHENVEADRGRVALSRGPLLYCFEEVDVNEEPESMVLDSESVTLQEHREDFLGGVTVLEDKYGRKVIPFYAWNNREPGMMAVWVRDGHLEN